MRCLSIGVVFLFAPLSVLADDGATQITFHTGLDADPDWSPDGSQIAFHRIDIGFPSNIWIIPAAGGSATQVTHHAAHRGGVGHPCWSPDGSEIAYDHWWCNYGGPCQSIIQVVPADGGTPTTIPIIGVPFTARPCWSPDGGMIAFESSFEDFWSPDIGVVPAAGGTAMQVTSHGGGNPAWSPDGSLIAFDHPSGGGDIWVIPASGGLAVPLSCGGWEPAWAPDGSQIAFAKETDGNWDIWTRPATLGGAPPALTRITTDPAVDRQPSWSPDGSKIAFTSDRSGNEDIWVIASTGPVALDQESWGSIKSKYRE